MIYLPHHTAISVRNLHETLSFYGALGFKEVHRYVDEDKTGVKMKLGDYILEIFAFEINHDQTKLNYQLGNNLSDIGVKHIALTADDIDSALEDLRSKDLANDKTKILTKGDAKFFFIEDPDGMWIEIIKDNRYS